MQDQPDYTNRFRTVLESRNPAPAELDRIERRVCASDDYDGAEYKFYGSWIPTMPLIKEVAKIDHFAIEELQHIDESSDDNDLEPHLNVFVADLREDHDHPAFVDV